MWQYYLPLFFWILFFFYLPLKCWCPVEFCIQTFPHAAYSGWTYLHPCLLQLSCRDCWLSDLLGPCCHLPPGHLHLVGHNYLKKGSNISDNYIFMKTKAIIFLNWEKNLWNFVFRLNHMTLLKFSCFWFKIIPYFWEKCTLTCFIESSLSYFFFFFRL